MKTKTLFAVAALAAQAWPSKPIRIVVPCTPGGSSDIIARTISGQCSKTPSAQLAAKGAGFEIYTVACSSGNAMSIRCEFGNCRVLR